MAKKTEAQKQVAKTVGLVTGVIGLGVVQGVSAPLTGPTGTIVQKGVLPLAGTALLKPASGFGSHGQTFTVNKKKRR